MIKKPISRPECVFADRIFLIIQNRNIYSYYVPYAAKHIYAIMCTGDDTKGTAGAPSGEMTSHKSLYC